MPDNYDIGLPEFDVIDRKESSSGDYVYVLKLKDELKEQYKTYPSSSFSADWIRVSSSANRKPIFFCSTNSEGTRISTFPNVVLFTIGTA